MGAGFFSGLGDVVDTRIQNNIKWTRDNYTDNKNKATKMGAAITTNTNKELTDLTEILNKASTLNIPKSALNGAYKDGSFAGLKKFVNTIASRDDLRPADHRQIYKAASAYADGADVDFNMVLKRALDVVPRGGSAKNTKSSWLAAMIGLGREGEGPITSTGPFGELSQSQTQRAFSQIGSPYSEDTTLDNIKFPEVRIDIEDASRIIASLNKNIKLSKKNVVSTLVKARTKKPLSDIDARKQQGLLLRELENLDVSQPLAQEQFAERVEELNRQYLKDPQYVGANNVNTATLTSHGRIISSPYELLASTYQTDERLIFQNFALTDNFKNNYRSYLNSLPKFNTREEAKENITQTSSGSKLNRTYPITNYIFVGEELMKASEL